MGGYPIQEAKTAMKYFFQSLPEGVKFNIVKFGSKFVFFNEISLDYSDENLEKAKKYIDEIDANLGGTELYQFFLFFLF
jgi:hypothetical protein